MMAKGLIGKKIGMTQVFDPESREAIPVTVIQVGPCTVTQVKTLETDGYSSIQIGYEEQKPQRVPKPQKGHFKKSGTAGFKILREIDSTGEEAKVGDVLTVSMFEGVSRVDVAGTTKGRGFQGVIKRYNQARGDKTHGGHCYRIPGSIGNCSTPSKVWKGLKMPGQMGNVRRTVQNLEIVKRDEERNLLFVRGAVPGARNGILYVQQAVKG